MSAQLDRVDYTILDRVKNACIAASRKTLRFADDLGVVLDEHLGASANLFALDLTPFQKHGKLHIGLVPEGLGTADDARPEDLSDEELRHFWHNIAYKTLATMTNDAASAGLRPLLISLYLPSAQPEVVFTEAFLDGFLNGFVEGCRTLGCVYIGGETPQLKSKVQPGVLDIAGAVFGVLPPNVQPAKSAQIEPGDSIVLIASSGPHENGFTSLRDLSRRLPHGYRTQLPSGEEYWRAINKGSVLYSPLVQKIHQTGVVPIAFENVTGHGWLKLMRSRQPLRYRITKTLPMPEVFPFVAEQAGLGWADMFQQFNCGAGFALFLRQPSDADKVVELANAMGYQAIVAGKIEGAEKREVVITEFNVTLSGDDFALSK